MKKQIIDTNHKKYSIFKNSQEAKEESIKIDKLVEESCKDFSCMIYKIINYIDQSNKNEKLDIIFTILDDCIILSTNCQLLHEENFSNLLNDNLFLFFHVDKLMIISNDFYIKYDKNFFQGENSWQEEWGDFDINNTDVRKPWQQIPMWIEKIDIDPKILEVTKNYRFSYVLYFKDILSSILFQKFLNNLEFDSLFFIFLYSDIIDFRVIDQGTLKYQIFKNYAKIEDRKITILNLGSFNFYVRKYTISNPTPEEIKIGESQLNIKNLEIIFAVHLTLHDNKYVITLPPKADRLLFNEFPSKVNFEFPFLIKSNFIFDENLEKLTDDPINCLIFKYLPDFLHNLCQTDLVYLFGNSYFELISHKFKMRNPTLNKFFFEGKNLLLSKNPDVYIKTRTDDIQPLNKCFVNQVKLNVKYKYCDSLEKVFALIFDQFDLKKVHIILEEFFLEKYKIIFNEKFEIIKDNLDIIESISKFYNNSHEINKIKIKHLVKFGVSSQFKTYYSNQMFIKYLEVINELNLNDSLYKAKPIIFLDNSGQLNKAKSIVMFDHQGFMTKEEHQIIVKISFNKEPSKVAINHELQMLLNPHLVRIIQSIGVKVIYREGLVKYLNKILNTIYNEKTSILLIRVLYKFWCNNLHDRHCINFRTQNLKFITETGDFVYPEFLYVGQFFDKKTTMVTSPSFTVSSKYYIEGSDFGLWINFFESAGMISNQEVLFNKTKIDHLFKMPFFCQDYLDAIKSKLKNQEGNVRILIFPFLNEMIRNNKISDVIALYYKDLEKSNQLINFGDFKFPNFLMWNLINKLKLVPTIKDALKPLNEVYDVKVLNEEIEILNDKYMKRYIEKLLEETFSFINSYIKEMIDQKTSIRKKLSSEDRMILLNIISEKYNFSKENSLDLTAIKFYYFKLLNDLYLSNTNFSGKLMDINGKFRAPSELCLMLFDKNLRTLEDFIKKKYKLIKFPEDDFYSNYKMNFSEKNKDLIEYLKTLGVKIYTEKSFTTKITNAKQNMSINYHLKTINFNDNLAKVLTWTDKEKSENFSKIKNLIFIECENIVVNSEFAESFETLTFHIIDNNQNDKIYYLKNDVYKEWSHPSIAYYLANHLCHVLKCEDYHSLLVTMLQLKSQAEIETWINKSLNKIKKI
jgi:hypothetical protein